MKNRAGPTCLWTKAWSRNLHSAREKVHHQQVEFEACVRRSPTRAVLSAFAAGYLLKMLPVKSIMAAQVQS